MEEDPMLRDDSSSSDDEEPSGSDTSAEELKEKKRRKDREKKKKKTPPKPKSSSTRTSTASPPSSERKLRPQPDETSKDRRNRELNIRRASSIQRDDEEDEESGATGDEDDDSSNSSGSGDDSSASGVSDKEVEKKTSKKNMKVSNEKKEDPKKSKSKTSASPKRVDRARSSNSSADDEEKSAAHSGKKSRESSPRHSSDDVKQGDEIIIDVEDSRDQASRSEKKARRESNSDADWLRSPGKGSHRKGSDGRREEEIVSGDEKFISPVSIAVNSPEMIPLDDQPPSIDSPRAYHQSGNHRSAWMEETGDVIVLDASMHLPLAYGELDQEPLPTAEAPGDQVVFSNNAAPTLDAASLPLKPSDSIAAEQQERRSPLMSSLKMPRYTPEVEQAGVVMDASLRSSSSAIGAPPATVFKSEERIGILQAHTTLLMPFVWADPTNAKVQNFINPLLRRTFIDARGERQPIWRISNSAPPQVADLDRRFRRQLGFDHAYVKEVANYQMPELDERASDIVWRLQLTSAVVGTFFEFCRLQCYSIDSSGKPQLYEKLVKVTGVTMAVFPYGTATVQFHFDWLPKRVPVPKNDKRTKAEKKADKAKRMTLEEFRTLLYLVKFRHEIPGVFRGWVFGPEKPVNWENELRQDHISSLGSKLCELMYENKPMPIKSMINWLLLHPEDDSDSPFRKTRDNDAGKGADPLGDEKRSYHHTSVVTESKLKSATLQQFLFYLRRAKGQINRPPVDESQLDKVLQLRRNRFVGVSREGIASISWPTTKFKDDFELTGWPMHFHTIYRVLAVFVHGERTTLAELSHLSALAGEKLKLVSGGATLESMAKGRKELLSLVTIMARYTMQMSSDDCGGMSDYVEFFTACRKVFKIKETRKELQTELTDVLRLVESNFYLEERAARKEAKKKDDLKMERRSRFDVLVGILTAVTLPAVVVGGLFGMNNDNLPKEADFFYILGGIVAASILLAFLFLVMIDPLADRRRRQEFQEKQERKKAKQKSKPLMTRMSLYVKRPFNRNSLAEDPSADAEVIPLQVEHHASRRSSENSRRKSMHSESSRGRATFDHSHSEKSGGKKKDKEKEEHSEHSSGGERDGVRRRGAIDEDRPRS